MPQRKAALATAYREEAARLVRAAAEPVADERIDLRIRRAADRLGWPFSRTRKIWHQEARRIDAWEMDQLRKVAGSPS